MIQDLHSHTCYSFCGKNTPEALIEGAISGGIDLLGISDHNYGIGYRTKALFKSGEDISCEDYRRAVKSYFDDLTALRDKYSDKIKILRGIEIATTLSRTHVTLPEGVDVSYFDYALVEHIYPVSNSSIGGDLFGFARRVGCPLGIAHTDLFAFIKDIGEEYLPYLKRMAKEGIFWEINVNYDSIHDFIEKEYVKRFFEDEQQQKLIRESGLKLSVGFDSHEIDEYLPQRVKDACRRLSDLNIPLMFEY